jgi:hypothetical protein
MKKKAFKFLLGLFVASMMITTGCKKDSDDDADKFVGNYSAVLTLTFSVGQTMTATGDYVIKKTASDKISMIDAGGIATKYTVSGNNITEDGGQTSDLPLSAGGTATFNENSTGLLNGITITINGTYTKTGYVSPTFTVVLTKK